MAIVWIKKRTRNSVGADCPYDVTISMGNSHKTQYLAFTFRNSRALKITKTGYIKIGVDAEAGIIYFDTGTERDGYKLQKPNNTDVHVTKAKMEPVWKKFIGNYILDKDTTENLFCVNLEDKF